MKKLLIIQWQSGVKLTMKSHEIPLVSVPDQILFDGELTTWRPYHLQIILPSTSDDWCHCWQIEGIDDDDTSIDWFPIDDDGRGWWIVTSIDSIYDILMTSDSTFVEGIDRYWKWSIVDPLLMWWYSL